MLKISAGYVEINTRNYKIIYIEYISKIPRKPFFSLDTQPTAENDCDMKFGGMTAHM